MAGAEERKPVDPPLAKEETSKAVIRGDCHICGSSERRGDCEELSPVPSDDGLAPTC